MPTLIVLLGWPLLEIAGFVWIGPYLGVAGTVAFVVTSAIVGMALLRREGIGLLMRIRRDVAARVVPVPTAVDGACRIAAALLLVVPGFFSTTAGLLLLLPPVRRLVVEYIRRRTIVWGVAARHGPTVIDATWQEIRMPGRDLPPGA